MKLNTQGAVRAGLFVLVLAALCSCKGRTAENMVPSGDTVEVVISSPDSTVSEVAISDSTSQ